MSSCDLPPLGHNSPPLIQVGDRVKTLICGMDYFFEGVVVSAFTKLAGQDRYVVEDDRGMLAIFNINQLRVVTSWQGTNSLLGGSNSSPVSQETTND